MAMSKNELKERVKERNRIYRQNPKYRKKINKYQLDRYYMMKNSAEYVKIPSFRAGIPARYIYASNMAPVIQKNIPEITFTIMKELISKDLSKEEKETIEQRKAKMNEKRIRKMKRMRHII